MQGEVVMSLPPRLVFPGTTILVTSRIESGLPLTAAAYMNLTIQAMMARAQRLFPVTLCHFVVMGNHIHLLISAKSPEVLSGFMNLYKTDIAHVVNKLRGRRQRTVWKKGFDTATILTLDDVVEKIVYIYTNPQQANLEKTIEAFPGVSSWRMYMTGEREREFPALRRSHYGKIERGRMSRSEQMALADGLKERTREKVTLHVDPDAWMENFNIRDPEEKANINRRIRSMVREREEQLDKVRIRDGKGVVGRDPHIDMPLDYEFTPKKFSKRMWCICRDIPKRVDFILFVKGLIKKARDVRERWKVGDFSVPFPLGLHPPRMHRRGNLLPGYLH
jgi:REP element-mobilizing transposase RayT